MSANTIQPSDEETPVGGPFFSDRDHQRYLLWRDRVSLGILGREGRGPLPCRHSSRFIEPPAENGLSRFIVKKEVSVGANQKQRNAKVFGEPPHQDDLDGLGHLSSSPKPCRT